MRGCRTAVAQLKGNEVAVKALELFVDASAFTAEDAKKLSALVQMTDDDDADDDDMGAPAVATYEAHSDGIVTTWKVKNSWGAFWDLSGYALISRLPGSGTGKVFTVEMHHPRVDQACTGDNVGLNIKDLDKNNMSRVGDHSGRVRSGAHF